MEREEMEVEAMVAEKFIIVTGEFHKETRRWTAECPELGTATFGRSLPEAEERLLEAIVTQLNTLVDVGEISNFFREHGIKMYNEVPKTHVRLNAPIRTGTFVRPLYTQVPVGALAGAAIG